MSDPGIWSKDVEALGEQNLVHQGGQYDGHIIFWIPSYQWITMGVVDRLCPSRQLDRSVAPCSWFTEAIEAQSAYPARNLILRIRVLLELAIYR